MSPSQPFEDAPHAQPAADRRRSNRWPWLSWGVGLLLVVDAAACARQVVLAPRDDWGLIARTELGLYGGLWLVSGLFGRSAFLVLTPALGLLAIADMVRAIGGQAPRPLIGQAAASSGWIVLADLVLCGLVIWARPRGTRLQPHPRRGVVSTLAVLLSILLGLSLDSSGLGQFPIRASVSVEGSKADFEYLVYLPKSYHLSLRRWPLLVALHGGGARGGDLDRVRGEGLPPILERHGMIPFVVVAPHSGYPGWTIPELDVLLTHLLSSYRIDRSRVYLTGYSMGGMGTWSWAAAQPQRFAAIAPICGAGDPRLASRYRDLPIWAFHGDQDRAVPLDRSLEMTDAVNQAGGHARLTIYPGVGHDSWTQTYLDPRFYSWLLEHQRPDGSR